MVKKSIEQPSTTSRAPKAKSKPEAETKLKDKVAGLEKEVVDLQLLNEQCMSVVKKLQQESHEKSRKMAEMEEAASKGARYSCTMLVP